MTENMHTSNIGDIFFISRALDLECPMKLVYNMTLFFFFFMFFFLVWDLPLMVEKFCLDLERLEILF